MLDKAIIAAVEDTEKRWRFRVFIMGVHVEGTPADALPQAELCAGFSTKQGGDLPPYEEGDTVWVDYQRDGRPIIMGGWITNSHGIPDVLLEQVESWTRNRRRWVRSDRNGNRLELSSIGDENWAALRSGNASILVSQNGNAIRLNSASGPLEAVAKVANFTFETFAASAHDIDFAADYNVLGVPLGKATLRADRQTNVHGSQETNVGHYLPEVGGVPVSTVKQSVALNAHPLTLNLGAFTGDTFGGVPLAPTTLAWLRALVVKVKGTTFEVDAGAINLKGAVTVTGDLAVTGDATVAGTVTGVTAVVQGITPLAIVLGTHQHPYVNVASPAVTGAPNPV